MFELTEDGYRELTAGDLLAANDTTLLLRRCEELTRCRFVWVDRFDGTELALPEPRIDAGQVARGRLSAGGRVLSLGGVDGAHLFDLSDGSPIEEPVGLWDPGAISVSPDERYLVVSEGRVRVLDLDTDEWFDLGSAGRGGRALFVADG